MLPWWLFKWLLSSAAAAVAVAWLLHRLRRRTFSLLGKTVFVSGATSGLGEALAGELVSRGARVVLGGRDAERLEAVRERLLEKRSGRSSSSISTKSGQPFVSVVKVDLNNSDEDLAGAVARQIWTAAGGKLDVLVNNAGQSYRGDILSTEGSVHRQLMQVNYFGHVALTASMCRLAAADNRSLAIVGISSLQGLVAQPYRSAYAASKHAFQAFHDCLRAELAGRGFRVLTVSPAYIQTALSANALTGSGSAYGKTDESTRQGMRPEAAASAVLDALESGRQELILGPWHYGAAPVLRRLAPWIMFRVMEKRAGSGGVTR